MEKQKLDILADKPLHLAPVLNGNNDKNGNWIYHNTELDARLPVVLFS